MKTCVFAVGLLCLVVVYSRSVELHHGLQLFSAEVTNKFFNHDTCVAIITDSASILERYTRESHQVVHVRMDHTTEKCGFREEFNNWLLQSLNLGCLGYVIHSRCPVAVVKSLAMLARYATNKNNRRYLYLPAVNESCYIEEEFSAKDIFSLNEMNFMPDLVLAEVRYSRFPGQLLPVKENNGSRDTDSGNCGKCSRDVEKRKINMKIRTTLFESFSGGYDELCYKIAALSHAFVSQHPEEVLLLDVWYPSTGFIYGNNLYPDKINNLYGKTLRLATLNNVPYSVYNISDVQQKDAVELRFLTEFFKLHNSSWSLITDEHLWGDIWENMSGDGLAGLVVDDKVDLSFAGCFIIDYHYRAIDFSAPYYQSDITCLVPKPGLIPGWLTPFLPFSHGMWMAVVTFLTGTTFILSIITRTTNSSTAYSGKTTEIFRGDVGRGMKGPRMAAVVTLTLGVTFPEYPTDFMACRRKPFAAASLLTVGLLLLQSPPTNIQKSSSLRQLVTCIAVTFLLVASCYSSGLASVLTVPRYEHPIETVQDLADHGLPWAGSHVTWVSGILNATEPAIQQALKNFVVLPEDEMAQHTETRDMGFLMERLPGGHVVLGQHLTRSTLSSLRLMKEALYSEPIAVMLRKGSPYKESLNTLIHRLLDAGVFQYLIEHGSRTLLPYRIQIAFRGGSLPEDHEPIKLRLIHIQGALGILILGLSLATASFLLELGWHRLNSC